MGDAVRLKLVRKLKSESGENIALCRVLASNSTKCFRQTVNACQQRNCRPPPQALTLCALAPIPRALEKNSQTSNTSEKLRVSTANATHMLQAEARRRALAASADSDEHSDDDFYGGTTPSPFASPRASVTKTKAQAGRVFGKQGRGGEAGGAGDGDDASPRESVAAARRRSLVSQLAR